MRKFEKPEWWPALKAPAGVPERKEDTGQPQVKSTLLQTYFTSLLGLVLSVAMFLGTSYAWFSSEIENPVNELYVGTLKVGLLKEPKEEDAEPLDLANEDIRLFDETIRWEPGYTTIETIQVVNQGDLAFKYVMTFTDDVPEDADDETQGEPSGDETPAAADGETQDENSVYEPFADVDEEPPVDVAEFFDVWVFDHQGDKTYTAPDSYDDITARNGWTYVGTLADVLAGKAVLSGAMEDVRTEDPDADVINEGTTDGVSTAHRFTIVLHMKGEDEETPSAVMGQKISLNVKLVAYQLASEEDGFGKNTYDSKATADEDAEEEQEMQASGENDVPASGNEIADTESDGNGEANASGDGSVNADTEGAATASSE